MREERLAIGFGVEGVVAAAAPVTALVLVAVAQFTSDSGDIREGLFQGCSRPLRSCSRLVAWDFSLSTLRTRAVGCLPLAWRGDAGLVVIRH